MGDARLTSDSIIEPCSKICFTTSSSLLVPNSSSSCPFEAVSKMPCVPCLRESNGSQPLFLSPAFDNEGGESVLPGEERGCRDATVPEAWLTCA